MNQVRSWRLVRGAVRILAFATLIAAGSFPASAQNKKGSWEIFIYFGAFYSNQLPTATQSGSVTTYRVAPEFAFDPADSVQVFAPNLGAVGGNVISDPNDVANHRLVEGVDQYGQAPCFGNGLLPIPSGPGDSRNPLYADECDSDQEARWRYNAVGMVTNGEVQTDDSEFTLGLRAGYNITRHFEVELDIGFGKQRIDLTRNLDPLLTASINDISDPRAAMLASFYESTWANIDYRDLVPAFGQSPGEHPFVISSRVALDPAYNIAMYYPIHGSEFGGGFDPNEMLRAGETFADVTGFINRVLQDPTAFRNRGNQINIDNFSFSASVNYNFNTKADSRLVPYGSVGIGRWMRNFDNPYEGEDSNFYLLGAGMRFFVNEIFSFRADARYVSYVDDSFQITAKLSGVDLVDRDSFAGFSINGETPCTRDQFNPSPPCRSFGVPASTFFPELGGGGGNADLAVDVELDDFYEIRIGFDVILGGK